MCKKKEKILMPNLYTTYRTHFTTKKKFKLKWMGWAKILRTHASQKTAGTSALRSYKSDVLSKPVKEKRWS